MATPSPAAGITDANSNGPASNRFARELAKRETITKLLSFMLYDFDTLPGEKVEKTGNTTAQSNVSTSTSTSTSTLTSTPKPSEPGGGGVSGAKGKEIASDESENEPIRLPNRDSAASSVVHSIAVVIELIRKNNSDYFEPYLFHTLRNRLIQVQQQSQLRNEDSRVALEETMQEMVNRMGVVHLGPVLELMCQSLGQFHEFLKTPRSLVSRVLMHGIPLSLLISTARANLNNRRIDYTTNPRTLPHPRTPRRTPALLQHVSSQSTRGI